MSFSKSGRLSDMQKKSLYHFMEEELHLLNATFSSEFTYRVAKQKWVKIAKHLNCLPGAHKNWKQWRRTWHDLKQHVRKRRRLDPKVPLSEDDEKLFGLLEEYQDEYPDDPEMTSNAAAVSPEDPLNEETIFVEFVKSQSDEEELEEPENFQQSNKAELRASDDEERKKTPEHHVYKKVKKQPNIAEKMFRLKKSYYMRKMSIMQTYYQERIKIDQRNAESRERIACALDKISLKKNS